MIQRGHKTSHGNAPKCYESQAKQVNLGSKMFSYTAKGQKMWLLGMCMCVWLGLGVKWAFWCHCRGEVTGGIDWFIGVCDPGAPNAVVIWCYTG